MNSPAAGAGAKSKTPESECRTPNYTASQLILQMRWLEARLRERDNAKAGFTAKAR